MRVIHSTNRNKAEVEAQGYPVIRPDLLLVFEKPIQGVYEPLLLNGPPTTNGRGRNNRAESDVQWSIAGQTPYRSGLPVSFT